MSWKRVLCFCKNYLLPFFLSPQTCLLTTSSQPLATWFLCLFQLGHFVSLLLSSLFLSLSALLLSQRPLPLRRLLLHRELVLVGLSPVFYSLVHPTVSFLASAVGLLLSSEQCPCFTLSSSRVGCPGPWQVQYTQKAAVHVDVITGSLYPVPEDGCAILNSW